MVKIFLLDIDEHRHEVTRSSFLIQSTKTKINRINGIEEPFIPLWIIFLCRLLSFIVMLIFLALSILNIILMLYIRLKLFKIFHSIQYELIKENAFIIISIITSIISLIISVILDFIFSYLANLMTEFERHRYQSNFDASLTLKLFSKLISKDFFSLRLF
jgi:anoctamin-1